MSGDTKEALARIMKENGVECYGVCPYDELRGRELSCRAEERIPKGVRSCIVMLFPYRVEKTRGNVSAYAAVKDYHKVAGKRLDTISGCLRKEFAGNAFEWFCDNSPVPEVWAAARAGLGVIGRNRLLIHKRYGSYVFIGEILTDMPLPPSDADGMKTCIGCGACEAACPVRNLPEFERSRCLSEITQRKGELTKREEELLRTSGCAWGCDICQEACPLNRFAELSPLPELCESYRPSAEDGEHAPDRAFLWRGEKVIDRNLCILKKK